MKQGYSDSNSWRFIGAFVLCMVLALVGYSLFFRYKVMRDPTVVPLSYKQLLIEKVEGPRILIESGSNGLHAFDPELVEELTGYPTVILADHAGASLHDKIDRLYKFTVPGDIIVLPLEWNYYHAPDLSENHLRSLFDRGRGYFYSLPWWKQWLRAYSTPLAMVAAELFVETESRRPDYFSELDRLRYFRDHNFMKAPNGEAVISADVERLPVDSDCDGYIIPEFATGPISFTGEFKDALERLAELQDVKNVKVILTAPIVVGEDCYQNYGASLEPMVEKTRALCEELGLPHQLDFRRYAMPVEYLLDTHFHVSEEGSEVVTPLFIGDLVEAGLIQPHTLVPGQSVREQMPEIFSNLKLDLLAARMPRWHGNPTAVVDGDDRAHFFFDDAEWYEEESWGRWAKKAVVNVIFAPDSNFSYDGIYINANYFNGSQRTKVYLNDHLVAEQDFTKDHLIELEQPLKAYLDDRGLILMKFGSTDLTSPAEVDGSKDVRKLKFGLHSLQLMKH